MTKALKHLKLISKHKAVVFYYCCKAGIPWRGFMHDWSKYSPTEFLESIKYYTGVGSPINEAKKDKGYSMAWQHHKGRNPHHYEYWVGATCDNIDKGGVALLIPYKYVMEMCCDIIAANKIYAGKSWTPDTLIEYWNREKDVRKLHPAVRDFQTDLFYSFKEKGFEVFKKGHTKPLYEYYVNLYKSLETVNA